MVVHITLDGRAALEFCEVYEVYFDSAELPFITASILSLILNLESQACSLCVFLLRFSSASFLRRAVTSATDLVDLAPADTGRALRVTVPLNPAALHGLRPRSPAGSNVVRDLTSDEASLV